MERRDFLKHAAVIGGVALVGLPDISLGRDQEEQEGPEETAVPNYTLFGVKRLGCALPRNYHHQSEVFPEHVAKLLR
jgi:hypothetical protein